MIIEKNNFIRQVVKAPLIRAYFSGETRKAGESLIIPALFAV